MYIFIANLSNSLHEMFVIIKKKGRIGIFHYRNNFVLMVNKRRLRKTMVQKVKKKPNLLSLEFLLFALELFVSG